MTRFFLREFVIYLALSHAPLTLGTRLPDVPATLNGPIKEGVATLASTVPNATQDGIACRHLYISTQGAGWERRCQGGWNTTDPAIQPCGQTGGPVWFGMTCNEQFRVVAINLEDCLLNGPLPDSFGALSELNELTLSNGNSLQGTNLSWGEANTLFLKRRGFIS